MTFDAMGGEVDSGSVRGLPAWAERNAATAAMLNPAVVAATIIAAAERYDSESGEPMPWEYSFLIAPIVFHRSTRRAIPNRMNAHLTKWVKDNPVLSAGVPARARAMVPFVQEGLRHGLSSHSLELDGQGRLRGELLSNRHVKRSTELAEIITKSAFMGRWLTKADRPATVFALLGVDL